MNYVDTFTKMPKNVGDLCKLIVAKGFNGCPKCNKSPNLVTLTTPHTNRYTLMRIFKVFCLNVI